MSKIDTHPRDVHPVDEVLPVPKLALYGAQHVLAFYAGAVIVPILLAAAIHLSTDQLIHLINADLFTCGIASIIQSVGFWKIGVRLPLLQGVTFTAVSPMIAIGLTGGGGSKGLRVIYGSVIVAGLFTFFLAPHFSKLIKYFPPVVTGSVITIIGMSLLPVAASDVVNSAPVGTAVNGRDLAYGLGTLALIVAIQRIFRGFMGTVAVLIGLVVGTLVAWGFGDAHFGAVRSSAVVGVTTPFYFGAPKFVASAIIAMIIVMLITAVETTGDVFATGEIVDKRITRTDIARALRADGLATTLGGLLNSFPYTCFAENVGLVRLTKVKSRWVVTTAGIFMIMLGLLPKAAAVVAGIPLPVLGGAALAMFATVAVVGIQTLSRVDLNDHRNIVILASSLGVAMLVTAQPNVITGVPAWAQTIFGSGICVGSLTAIGLNVIFHHIGGRHPEAAAQDGAMIGLAEVNAMSQDEFIATFARLYQGSDCLALRVYAQIPFDTTQNLRTAFQEALFDATGEQKQVLMDCYPDLASVGVELDDHADAALSEYAILDQRAAGLTHLGEEDQTAFGKLTTAYRDRFGFPLIVCLRDDPNRQHILDSGWARMHNSMTQERATALIEIAQIANYRFDLFVTDVEPAALASLQRS
jgi:OHCU decarboxylase